MVSLRRNNRRFKIGWGKISGPLPPTLAVLLGVTPRRRNAYVGFDLFAEEKLKHDFGEYGEIELVHSLKEKNCVFVNFINVHG